MVICYINRKKLLHIETEKSVSKCLFSDIFRMYSLHLMKNVYTKKCFVRNFTAHFLFWKLCLIAASIFCCWCWNTLALLCSHDLPEETQSEDQSCTCSFDNEWHYSKWSGYNNEWDKSLLSWSLHPRRDAASKLIIKYKI